ncbi:flagellar assembly protein FliW [Orenia marismortui]|uniref:flagellar assembly protein FliW n=1 Tax=Orenia marismortui TaxID=46469 RepID=UPI00035EF5EB|nr:flagellar assembly protein FliW [Orenia marismortui]
MEIETRNFGIIDVEKDKIIELKKPILGFDEYTKFTVIDSLDDDVFYYLQSIEEPDLFFIMIDPTKIIEDYKIKVTEKFQEDLKIDKLDDIIVYTLVVVSQRGEYITTNLKAPIIINHNKRLAGQLVIEEDYPTRYYLVQEANNRGEAIG